MKKIFILMIHLHFSPYFSSQISPNEIDKKIETAYKLSNTERKNEAIKLLTDTYNESKKSNYKKGILSSGLGLMSAYAYVGDYSKLISLSKETESIAKEMGRYDKLASLYMIKGIVYKNSGFLDESLASLNKSIYYGKKIKDKEDSHFHLSRTYQNIAAYYEKEDAKDSILYFLKESLSELESIKATSKEKELERDNEIIYTHMNIANYYLGISSPSKIKLAEEHFEKIYKYENTEAYKINNLIISSSLGRFYLEKGEVNKAIDYANKVLMLEKVNRNPGQRRAAYFILFNAYDKLENTTSQIKYLKLYTHIDDSINSALQSSLRSSARQITQANNKEYADNIKKIVILTLCGLILMIGAVILCWKQKMLKTKRKYEKIISIFKEDRRQRQTALLDNESEILEKNKSIDIAETTVKSILISLEKFENTNEFIQKDVNLSYLAHFTNTNTKYLNEILKTHKEKSFSKYINGLRINYIMKLLYMEPKYQEYKISYLANISGFSSREVFSTVFKKETGMTTSYYIKKLKDDVNQLENIN